MMHRQLPLETFRKVPNTLEDKDHRARFKERGPCGYFGDPRRACACTPSAVGASRRGGQLGANRWPPSERSSPDRLTVHRLALDDGWAR
jgi:hypothetical protein